MILHLVSDHFVTNTCLKIFREKLPGQNIVLVYKKFGHQVDGDYVVTDADEDEIAKQIDFSQITHVVISFQTRRKIHFIRKYVPTNIPVIWWTYGVDLYVGYLEKRGYKVFYSDPDKYRFGGILSWPLFKLFRPFQYLYIRYLQNEYFIKRLYGFIPCISPEHGLLCQYVNNKDFNLIQIHPYGASFKFDGRFSEGKDIAIGHSASISDNHLYALKFLKNLDLGNSDLYLTLSYSNKVPRYTEEVKKKFKKEYGDKVHLIETMMPKEEYFESQFRYKMMILPSWRQEGLDNVYTCLQIGIKLVLSERSIVFQYLKEYGFFVYAIEQMDQNCLDTPLTLEEKKHNQQLFVKFVEERKRNYYADFEKYFMSAKTTDNEQ